MSEPAQRFDSNFEHTLSNAGVPQIINETPAFRGAMLPPTASGMTVERRPVLPPRPPDVGLQQQQLQQQPQQQPQQQQGYAYVPPTGYAMTGMSGGYGMGGYGGYGMGGYGGYGMGGMGNFGSHYGGFNRFGPMYGGDIESRFIQMAEENSRPAFDSIQSVVHAVGSVAMMMENTFFALTSSFRAILGVAENFGRLRSLFAQVWSTFAVVRSLNWMIRKLMVMIGIRTEDEFKAWAQAVQATQNGTATPEQKAKGSSWPILVFFGVIAAAPYIVLKMLNNFNGSNEDILLPATWKKPFRAIAQHDFVGRSQKELSFSARQMIIIAPQNLQKNLWNSGWLLGTIDNERVGLVPVTYIKLIKPNNPNEANQAQPTYNTDNKIKEPFQDELNKVYEQELQK